MSRCSISLPYLSNLRVPADKIEKKKQTKKQHGWVHTFITTTHVYQYYIFFYISQYEYITTYTITSRNKKDESIYKSISFNYYMFYYIELI